MCDRAEKKVVCEKSVGIEVEEVTVERPTENNASSDTTCNEDTTNIKEVTEVEIEELVLDEQNLKAVINETEQISVEEENIHEDAADTKKDNDDTVVNEDEVPEKEEEGTVTVTSEEHTEEIANMALESEELLQDLLTPILKTLILNIVLPTLDVYLDVRFVHLLFPEYWGCGLLVVGGILANFLFTALAWWRLEPRHLKSCTWLLLLLQVWPQFKGVQVIWLTMNRDPRAAELGELMDREVTSLEPFLEALPSMFVLRYMVKNKLEFTSSAESYLNLVRAVYMTVLGMTLFLKNGPCFILPRRGIFGFVTWRSFVAFSLCFISLNVKYMLVWYLPSVNSVFMATFSVFIALLSLYEGLGCWKSICRMVLSCPPLVILPIFGFFTFGRTQAQGEDVKGVALSSKWTMVNMLGSCLLSLVRYLSSLSHTSLVSLHAWLLQFPGAHQFTHFKGVGLYFYCLISTFSAIFFTLLLLWWPVECGVILPHLPGVLHVVQEGEVLPLIHPPPPTFTRWRH